MSKKLELPNPVPVQKCEKCGKEFEAYIASDDCHHCHGNGDCEEWDDDEGCYIEKTCWCCKGQGYFEEIEIKQCKNCRITEYDEDDYE